MCYSHSVIKMFHNKFNIHNLQIKYFIWCCTDLLRLLPYVLQLCQYCEQSIIPLMLTRHNILYKAFLYLIPTSNWIVHLEFFFFLGRSGDDWFCFIVCTFRLVSNFCFCLTRAFSHFSIFSHKSLIVF